MMHPVRILQLVAILGCASSCFYYVLCLWSAATFLRASDKSCGADTAFDKLRAGYIRQLPVSILKPLKGIDPEIYESFRSHCLQDYSEYEIIFGVSDAEDPAVARVEQLQREFPARTIRLIVCAEKLGANVKVSNLEHMLPHARHEYLLINDSDIRVERGYLQRVMSPLADERVGMVTCLYRGVAAPTLGSRLEALGIATDFCGGVLVARQLEGGIRFGLGSTLAFRRRDLERIGGFRAIADYLADDYELGRRIADLGLQVKLSDVVVETHLPAYNLSGFFLHQLRWARGVRDARAGGYIGLITTFGLMWSLLAVVFAPGSVWSWSAFTVTMLLRVAVAIVIGKSVLRDGNLLSQPWLLPIRDLVAVGVWVVSFFGHTITWRGDRFELKNGRLIRIP